MHYLLTYDVVSDYVARRAPLRAAHMALARAAAVERGDLDRYAAPNANSVLVGDPA